MVGRGHYPALATVGALLAVQTSAPLLAQSPESTLATFEVASIKPNTSNQPASMVGEPGGRFTAINTPLRFFIRTAYRIQDDQIVGGPGWLNTDRFDILAKAEPTVPPFSQLLPMMRALLAERFKLAVHSEVRELPVYALVVAKSDGTFGPRFKVTDCPLPQNGARPCANISQGPGRLTLRGMPITDLLQFLAPATNRVVVDRSRLTGRYDVDLEWQPDQLPQRPAGAGDTTSIDTNRSSIFTAVQEQLGLKLEATRAPVDVIVIDHVEQPTPD